MQQRRTSLRGRVIEAAKAVIYANEWNHDALMLHVGRLYAYLELLGEVDRDCEGFLERHAARRCAAAGCGQLFIPYAKGREQIYHSPSCRSRANMRRFRERGQGCPA